MKGISFVFAFLFFLSVLWLRADVQTKYVAVDHQALIGSKVELEKNFGKGSTESITVTHDEADTYTLTISYAYGSRAQQPAATRRNIKISQADFEKIWYIIYAKELQTFTPPAPVECYDCNSYILKIEWMKRGSHDTHKVYWHDKLEMNSPIYELDTLLGEMAHRYAPEISLQSFGGN
jgi:hypothetical protein